jgi:protease I
MADERSSAEAPPGQTRLSGRRVAFLATDGVEQVELTEPWKAVKDAGATPELISIKSGEIQGLNHLDKGDTFRVDTLVSDAKVADYAALVIPGGVANPDAMRVDPKAVAFVRAFLEMDKPVAAICHAPWMLVEADAVRGRSITSWPSLKTDVRNAGGDWVDREVVTDQKLVTSRKPADLPAFCSALLAQLEAGAAESQLDNMVEQTFPASDPLPGPTSIGNLGASRSDTLREQGGESRR